MKWWGALSCLLVSQGLALGPGGPSQCHNRCLQVYSVHTNEFDQNPALEACQRGCEFFSRIEFRNGVQEPLNSLRNCNYSCDERFEGPGLPANQAVGSTLTMVSPILLLLLHKSLHRDQTSSELKILSDQNNPDPLSLLGGLISHNLLS